ncbi:MAG TPA: alpha/beta fold hydrolase [Acidobacteriaceae bacterium]|nr:alpha/beta fold hydrolase [Acidobacteriaceae bacterium]
MPHQHVCRAFCRASLPVLFAALAVSAAAQSRVVDATVHSPGLEHNRLGDPADQPVCIVLPAAYDQDAQRRFPVLYFLHGFADSMPLHSQADFFRTALDRQIAAGAAQPFIVVVPNGLNKYLGAFYANSSTTGNWDDYITRDVVRYVDAHYRTFADPAHRVLSGHSMGGYGALTLAFRHPDVFGSVYAMSPCCTDMVADAGPSNSAWKALPTLHSPDDVPAALHKGQFFVAAWGALDAALDPDPSSPIYGDPPFRLVDGELRTDPEAYRRIASNMPANMVVPLLPKIVQLRAIFIEYGAQENFTHIVTGAQELSQRLSQAGVSHTLEVFQGDHVDHLTERIAGHLLPWASDQLYPANAPRNALGAH